MREFFHNITKGEIIITCIAFIVWTTICIFINTAISNAVNDSNELYYKAVQISEDNELFEYATRTNAGNALVYGTASCVDSVSDDMLTGNYCAIKVTIDRYERNVSYEDIRDEDGNVIGQKEVVSYDWEYYKTKSSHASKVNFLGKEFSYDTFDFSNYSSLELDTSTVDDKYDNKISWNYIYPDGRFSHSVGDFRYKFQVIPLEQKITVFADLRDSTMFNVTKGNKVKIHYDTTIDEVMESVESSKNLPNILFCIFWYIIFIISAVIFIQSRNKWADC